MNLAFDWRPSINFHVLSHPRTSVEPDSGRELKMHLTFTTTWKSSTDVLAWVALSFYLSEQSLRAFEHPSFCALSSTAVVPVVLHYPSGG